MRSLTTSCSIRPRSLRSLVAGMVVGVAGLLGAASPALALSYPTSSGTYTFALYTGNLSSGTGLTSGNISSSTDVEWSDLSSQSFNDMAASYSLCNDTGSEHTFTVKIFADADYTTLSQSDSLTIDTGSCAVVNLSSTDTASSAVVLW